MNLKQMELLKGKTIKEIVYDDGYYGIHFEDIELFLTFEDIKGTFIYVNELKVNVKSTKEHSGIGNIFSISDFIKHCENSSFIDYDGYANELVLDNKVIASFYETTGSDLSPSDLDIYKEYLLELNEQHPSLGIVWYNR